MLYGFGRAIILFTMSLGLCDGTIVICDVATCVMVTAGVLSIWTSVPIGSFVTKGSPGPRGVLTSCLV